MRQKRRILRTYGLWFVDILCIILTYTLATKIRFRGIYYREMNSRTINDLCCLIFVLISTFYSFFINWTSDFLRRGYFDEFMAVLKYMVVLFVGGTLIVFLLNWGSNTSRLVFAMFGCLNLAATYAAHCAYKKFLRWYFRGERQSSKLIVVAQRGLLQSTLQALLDQNDSALEIVGGAYVDEDENSSADVVVYDVDMSGETCSGKSWDHKTEKGFPDDISLGDSSSKTTRTITTADGKTFSIPVYSGYQNLTRALVQLPFDEVLINAPDKPMTKLQEIVDGFEDMGVDCHFVLRMPDRRGSVSRVETYKGFEVVTYSMNRQSYKKLMVKRLVDIIGGLVGLALTGIIWLFVAPAIKIESPGPVFFSQIRVGKNGRRFRIWKFRSMYQDAEARLKDLLGDNEMSGYMFKMENDPRVTKVGRFIRKTSLDEFPQFWNVLKGDMSLVGTRPPTEQEFEHYDEHYRRRLQMTPGLTGMWQVSGRSNIENFDDVVSLDLYYIDHWSLTLDFKILLQTIAVVFAGKGAK